MGWLDGGARIESPQATFDDLTRFHHADYVTALREADEARNTSAEARKRFGFGTFENPVFKGVFKRASMTVGGSMRAAQLAIEKSCVAYHPAGGTHHGRPDRASGFCYFNDPVFAILTLLDHRADRVAYIDLDAHHGDGVQDAFARDPRVLTISLHEDGRWPYSGKINDRGGGNARNLPVPPQLNDTEFRFLFDEAIMPVLCDFAPQAIVVTCGADVLAGDPLSKLTLSNVALWDAVDRLAGLDLPTVILGGGGYNPWTVARCWSGLWATVSKQAMPEQAPEQVRKILGGLECDLVDQEDVRPEWIATIADITNDGDVRDRIVEIARQTMAGHAEASL